MSIKTMLELVFYPLYLLQLGHVGFMHFFSSQTCSSVWKQVWEGGFGKRACLPSMYSQPDPAWLGHAAEPLAAPQLCFGQGSCTEAQTVEHVATGKLLGFYHLCITCINRNLDATLMLR